MGVVDEGFNGVLIFCGVLRWTPLGEYGVFELGDVDLEDWFLRGVEVPISVFVLSISGSYTSLLLHFSCSSPW